MNPSLVGRLAAASLAAALLGACASESVVVYPQPPVWCYVSLADRECYAAPVPGQGYRLAGTRPTEPR